MTPLKLDFVWKSFINTNNISIILDKLKLHLQLLAYYVKYIYINAVVKQKTAAKKSISIKAPAKCIKYMQFISLCITRESRP